MSDLPIRPEAIDAATTAYVNESGGKEQRMAAGIAAFCEAEKLAVEEEIRTLGVSQVRIGPTGRQRLIGPWREVEEGR